MNDYLINNVTLPLNNGQEIYYKFTKESLINESFIFYNISTKPWLEVYIRNFDGIVAGQYRLFEASWQFTFAALFLASGNLYFYDTNQRLLEPSCDSYLKSYYSMTDEEYEKQDKKELFDNYIGVLAVTVHDLYVIRSVALNREICPIVFKHSLFKTFNILGIQNTALVKNKLKFTDMSDSFKFEYDLDATMTYFILQEFYNF